MSLLTSTEGAITRPPRDVDAKPRGVRESPFSIAMAMAVLVIMAVYFLTPVYVLFSASTKTQSDLANGSATRMAGSITAALYLERFVPEGQSWVHVDTYAWNDNDRPGKPFGGEAQGLRAALAFLRTWPQK